MLKVLFTGIPSSGKTTVINNAVERYREQGYNVLVIPETATEFILSGVKPFGKDGIDPSIFQELVLKKQLSKEALYESAALALGSDKTILLFDRGTLDGYAYVNSSVMNELILSLGLNKRDLLLNYDTVLFLEGKADFFTKENNKARYENSAEEAENLRKNLLNAYLGHDNLMVVKTREDMKDKEEEVVNIIANMLGNPYRLKDQRKFLVSDLDFDKLLSYTGDGVVLIKQDYLKSDDEKEYRLRKITQGDASTYHFAILKKHLDGTRDIIKEELLSETEYKRFLEYKDNNLDTIEKMRYSFVYANQYYKLDVFPDGLMILELNLTAENSELTLPDFVRVVEDVTKSSEYQNINLAGRKKKLNEEGKNNCCRGNRLFRKRDAGETVSE